MPRHYRCSPSSPAPGTCRFSDLQALLPSLQQSGYSVLNVDWPVHASPDTLFMGFGINQPYAVDPLLGSDADWARLVDAVHARGMKIVIDFNPSYWWTGSPSFKQAISDVRTHGLSNLPAASPARWFRWKARCPGARSQPPDNFDDLNEFTDAWVLSSEAGACYWAIWGGSDDPRYGGQPTADLTSPEWQAELTSILSYWVSDRGVDGFLIDAPPELLSVAEGLDVALHHRTTANTQSRGTFRNSPEHLGQQLSLFCHNFQIVANDTLFSAKKRGKLKEYLIKSESILSRFSNCEQNVDEKKIRQTGFTQKYCIFTHFPEHFVPPC